LLSDQANATIRGIRQIHPLNEDRKAFSWSLGGEIRETYERFHNTHFGLAPMNGTGIFAALFVSRDFHADSDFIFRENSTAHSNEGRTGVRAL